jgi:sugar porter (SP) family MFS transporter
MGGIIILDGFIADFGKLTSDVNPAINALLFSLIQCGAIIMFPLVGPINDRFGRRMGMQSGSLLVIVGTICEVATKNIGLFCLGRFLIGAGVVTVVTSAPTYVVEISHPVFRGRATALYNVGWNVGAIPAACLLFGLEAGSYSAQWQIPCGLQAAWSGVVLLGCFAIPESPRWLVSRGKLDEARKFLVKYHAAGDETSPIVSEQMKEIELAIETERSQNAGTYLALFNNRPNRLRSFIVIGVGFFSQAAGNWIAGYFQTQVVGYFGITSKRDNLMLQIVTAAISLAAGFTGSAFVDKVGRRPYLVYGTTLYIFFFTLLTILLAIFNHNNVIDGIGPAPDFTENVNSGPKELGIFAYVILQFFGIAYGICWTSINALYPVEVLSYSTRAKGMAMCQACVNLANIIQSWILSYGMNAYKWKFFSFFCLFNTFALVMIYLHFPETKGRTLEELDEIFTSPNPVKKSLEKPDRTFDDLMAVKGKAEI